MSISEMSIDADEATRLSYKFQRLRERLRQAIANGELVGKLPGERVLAKKFKVNAKTLSKALTDLAAEGVLDRSIGLGTFVRGSVTPTAHKCLVLRDADNHFADVAEQLACDDLEVHTHDHLRDLPPSMLTPHRSVIVLSAAVPEKTLRDLVVRGKTVVTVERRGKPYVTHAVMVDRAGDLAELGRMLVRNGHRELMIVDDHLPEIAADVFNVLTAAGANVRVGGRADILTALSNGVTALLCTRADTARRATDACQTGGFAVPGSVSVVAVGRQNDDVPCTGRYVASTRIAAAIQDLLREGSPHRPITLYLAGEPIDAGTAAAAAAPSA